TGLHSGQSACFAHGIGVCLGACVNQELPDDYNQRVQEVIAKFTLLGKSMLLIDKGTDINNKSVVYIEKGKVIGMGSFNLNFQINNIEILKTMLTPLTDN